MYSIFSNYLQPLYEAEIIRTKPTKPSEVYNQLRIAYNQGVTGILDSSRLFVSDYLEDEVEYDLVYKAWEFERMQKVIQWINKNITLRLGIDDYQTIGVKLRIATSMINNLADNNIISKKLSILMHMNLAFNVRGEIGRIQTEDLPF